MRRAKELRDRPEPNPTRSTEITRGFQDSDDANCSCRRWTRDPRLCLCREKVTRIQARSRRIGKASVRLAIATVRVNWAEYKVGR